MQSRKLKKILNNTAYVVHDCGSYIGIGSSMVHNLISLDKQSYQLSFALDSYREGRDSLKSKPELLFIWDKLQELSDSGEIKEIIEKDDILENPLPVWTYDNSGIIKTYTDSYGFPNVTVSGKLMYENLFFRTREEAVRAGISEKTSEIRCYKDRIAQLREDIFHFSGRLQKAEIFLNKVQGKEPKIKPKKLLRYRTAAKINQEEIEWCKDKQELNYHFVMKVQEELQEVVNSNFKDMSEFADLLSVVFDFAKTNNFGKTKLLKMIKRKVDQKGDYTSGILLNNLNPENPSNRIYFHYNQDPKELIELLLTPENLKID